MTIEEAVLSLMDQLKAQEYKLSELRLSLNNKFALTYPQDLHPLNIEERLKS